MFPCSLVPLFPCSPVTLFPSESVESSPCSSVNLKFFTEMKRPDSSVNGRGIFTCWVSERLISIFHRFWKGPFSRTEMPFLCTDVRACISSKRSKIGIFFLTNENIWLFSFFFCNSQTKKKKTIWKPPETLTFSLMRPKWQSTTDGKSPS